ncbi:hypothetical protein NEOLEDRAFT_1153890 [Neolentinus lepideus HHB14362 ss-1]|uniref:Uncharacterized protein n=1 Tax=Neolentinus lepideus HHB14362 ss-1 TaxID=1314782 RepID=A0A165V952_9AGAM|nr:hypothetical protein NEOLEDRAFT_1153890 [Neolentinus lepideus HHB14362 ss-1]
MASATSQPLLIPLLTVDEEDAIIHARITTDERGLKRLLKRFHNYTTVAHPHLDLESKPATTTATAEDAREAFLVELANFHLTLKKSMMICEAEARQVEEYQKEKQRIEVEHQNLRGQIEQLKTSLEEAQMLRRQKIEYDQIAEKINKLQTREQLEESIQALEDEMAEIQVEHDKQTRLVQAQKASLAAVISDINTLRLMGKEPNTSRTASPTPDTMDESVLETATSQDDEMSGKPEREEGENVESSIESPLNPAAKSFAPSRTGTPLVTPAQRMLSKAMASSSDAPSPMPTSEDDIEMGEVAEEPKDVNKGKRKVREELEEGEASDSSSELSELPDD